jgi:hypothetical protein
MLGPPLWPPFFNSLNINGSYPNNSIHSYCLVKKTFLTRYCLVKKNISPSLIIIVFKSVADQNGQKFVYSKVLPDLNQLLVKNALELLTMAGLIIPITHSAANGVPLGAEINPKLRKFIVFDSGIFQRLHGLKLSEVLLRDDFESINKGAITELCVGLELIKSASCYQRQTLYY